MWLWRQVAAIARDVQATRLATLGIQGSLSYVLEEQGQQADKLDGLIERTRHMASQQDQLNEIVAAQGEAIGQVVRSLGGIQGDLDAVLAQLKDAQANAQPLDLSGLEQVRADLAAVAPQAGTIDAENPAPAPEPVPAPEPAPEPVPPTA